MEIYLPNMYFRRVSKIQINLMSNTNYSYSSVNQETSEKSAEISKSWLQVWIPPTKIFKTAKIT